MNTNPNNLNFTKAYLFLTLASLFWSGNFIVGKIASTYEVPPFSLNFYRWLFALLILLPFTYKEVLINKNYIFKNLKLFIILGITSITIFNSIVYYSLHFTQVLSGILMISTIPVWILFFASIFKIERTNFFQILGVALSLLGVLFIITKNDIEIIKSIKFNKGDLFMVIGMLSWAIYSALLRKKKHPIYKMALLEIIIIFGLILFLILNYLIFKKNYKIGNCSFSFLIYYGVFRIFSEFFRLPDIQIAYIFGFVSMGMLLSTFMIFAGIILYFKRNDL